MDRIYFSPGMFGFGRLVSFEYFGHFAKALEAEFRAKGRDVVTYTVDVMPTASIRRRAAKLAELVAKTAGNDGGDIHLVGHSTGGLDARLVASPSCHLPIAKNALDWLPRLKSVSALNAPHYGTPLASFFATVSGQRMLYAISALTVVGLGLGKHPLSAISTLVWAVGRADAALDLHLLDRVADSIVGALEPARNREVQEFLHAIKEDQGAVIQLSPEAMDLFQAGVEDRPGVYYQCTATMAPPPTTSKLLSTLRGPFSAVTTALFATLQQVTSRYDERYPCAAPFAGPQQEAALAQAFGRAPGARANDGVVPLRSQLWGHVAWCGHADHLDVLGHFKDDSGGEHSDWMRSGAGFTRARFRELTTAIAHGMLEGRPAS